MKHFFWCKLSINTEKEMKIRVLGSMLYVEMGKKWIKISIDGLQGAESDLGSLWLVNMRLVSQRVISSVPSPMLIHMPHVLRMAPGSSHSELPNILGWFCDFSFQCLYLSDKSGSVSLRSFFYAGITFKIHLKCHFLWKDFLHLPHQFLSLCFLDSALTFTVSFVSLSPPKHKM